MGWNAALVWTLVNWASGSQVRDGLPESSRYLRWSGEKFVSECTIERQRMDDKTVLKSVTTRPGTTLTLAATFGPMDRLIGAEVTVEQGTEKRSARVTADEKSARVTRADGATSELKCSPGVIVTSAPDWTDAVCLVRRYDRTQGDKQEFPGLWIHPNQEPMNVRFTITRLGKDTVERDGQGYQLVRFIIELRGGSRYIGWGDERGRLVRLHPEGRATQGIWLDGWERARGGGWTNPEQGRENEK